METETKLTNEAVAEALGWRRQYLEVSGTSVWNQADPKAIRFAEDCLPDFMNDLNAAWKYVWPALRLLMTEDYAGLFRDKLWVIWNSPNPALYLCQRFMELKNGS